MANRESRKSLADSHPELAAEADGWDPSTVTAGSGRKLPWICGAGHKFNATVGNRTRKNAGGCPFCAGKKVWPGFNDLASTHPEIAKQAFGWNPQELTAGSAKIKEWICKNKHTWRAAPYSRVKGSGCPYCSGFLPVEGQTDLATSHPATAALAYKWDPRKIKAGSNKKLDWKCDRGHIWSAVVYNVAILGANCPICSGKKLQPGENDLATTHPNLVKLIVDGDPTRVTAGSDELFTWKCNKNHHYRSSISSKTRKKPTGCPVCSGNKIVGGINDLGTKNPNLALQANGWDPSLFSPNSHKKMSWKCTQGHIWNATIASRNFAKAGCPLCSGRDVITGVNDLLSKFPELAREAIDWDPSKVMAGSGLKRKWKCKEGHIWEAKISSRTLQGNGCPICSNQITLSGTNDLATTHKEMASEADGWDPSKINAGSNFRLQWKCKLGHTWMTSPNKRKTENTNCPYCAGRFVWPGFNDLATLEPELAKQARGWDPSKYTASSGKKMYWECEKGHSWRAAIYSRTGSTRTGCPTCSESGFDPNKKAFLYFIKNEAWEMFQIGITNNPTNRLEKHGKLGWELIEMRGPMDGHLTQQWETAILRMLKASGADLANSSIAGKFDGYSEAWSKNTFPVKSIKELMRRTEDFESNKNQREISP